MNAPASSAPLDQAIAWLVRTGAEDATAADHQACRRWRAADPAHEAAWQALVQSEARFRALPGEHAALAARALAATAPVDAGRRRVLRSLAIGGAMLGAGWLGTRQDTWQELVAQHRTAVGEIRRVPLRDGSLLHLDTDTAVDVLDAQPEPTLRLYRGRLRLESQALAWRLESGPAQVLGAPASALELARHDTGSTLHVLRGEARAHLRANEWLHVPAQRRYRLDGRHTLRLPDDDALGDGWTQRQLVARALRLDGFARELGRYRHGWLRCDPAVAALRVSGVFQLDDTERALAALARALPVRIERLTGLWVTIRAA